MKNIESRKKKILLCTGSFKTGKGGVASYAHDFIYAFPQYKFGVVTQDDYQKKSEDNFPIYHINMEDWSIGNALLFLELIEKFEPCIIINSYCKLLALITPYIDNNIKIISVSHFTDGGYAWAAGMNGEYADNLIALSKYAKAYLERVFKIKDKNKTHVVYNYMPSLPNIDIMAKKNANILKIIYPGGHSWQKSAEIVANVVQKLCKTSLPFEFYWIGNIDLPGRKWPFAKTKTIKDCLPMNDSRIKYVGRVERNISTELIANSNVFLLPSRGEGCPITLLEAMRAGCIPVISDARHGSFDIVENAKTGFVVKQNSVKDLFLRLKDVINNHSLYLKIYEETINEFEQKLEYKCWKSKMDIILESPLNHSQRKAFNEKQYKADVRYLKMLYCFDYIRDRFIRQLYHVIYFRYLHLKIHLF